MQIIRHLDLRLPFRMRNPSTLPAADQTSTSSTSPANTPNAITPEPDSAMAPLSPLEEFAFEPPVKPPWQEYMETSLSDCILKPNRIERGILRIIHKMFSSPPDDQRAAQRATQEVRDFWAYLYKKYVTRDELDKAGGERLRKLEMKEDDNSGEGGGMDCRGAGYFLEHAAGFVLEMAPMIDLADVNHGRIFRFLKGFRDGAGDKNVSVRIFDHKNPKFVYDPHAIGRAATVVWKYACPSVRSGINPSRVECDGRSAFSALLARLLSADLLPLQKAALLVHDIDLALCPDFFTDLQAQAQTQNHISSPSSSSSPRGRQIHIKPPAKIPTYILRCRELIAARNILIAGQHLGTYGLTYAGREVSLMVTQLDGTVLKINTNVPDWKWTMWLYAFGKMSVDAKERADKAMGMDFGCVNGDDSQGEGDSGSDAVWEGPGSFSAVAGGGPDDNNTTETDTHVKAELDEGEDDDCDKGILGQQRNIELGICAEKACLWLQSWIQAIESLKEGKEQVAVIEESEETLEATVPVQELEEQHKNVYISESDSDGPLFSPRRTPRVQEQRQQQYFVPGSESGSDDSDGMEVGWGVAIRGQDEDQGPGYITFTMEDLDFWSNNPGF